MEHNAPGFQIGFCHRIVPKILFWNDGQVRGQIRGIIRDGTGAVKGLQVHVGKGGKTPVTKGCKIIQKYIVGHKNTTVHVALSYRMDAGINGIQPGGNIF